MPVGPGATPDTITTAVKPAEKPVDPTSGKKAVGELRNRGNQLGKKVGLHEIRTGKTDDWLKDGDRVEGEENGFLRQEDPDKGVKKWQDDPATRDYLNNAQRYAQQQAEQGVEEIKDKLGLNVEQAAKKPFNEIVEEAGKKGLNVDPNTEEGQEILDYLRNAHEYARDLNTKKDDEQSAEAGEKKDEEETVQEVTQELALVIHNDIVELSKLSLEIYASGGDVAKKIQAIGESMIVTPEEGKQRTEQEVIQTARGYDLQIAGMQLEQQQIADSYPEAKEKKREELLVRNNELKKRIKQLQEERKQFYVPNEVKEFVKRCGVAEADAKANPLAALSQTLEKAITDKSFRKDYIAYLKQQANEGKLSKEGVETTVKFLNSETVKKFVKEKGLLGVKAAGGFGVLMLLMAWLATKEKQGQ